MIVKHKHVINEDERMLYEVFRTHIHASIWNELINKAVIRRISILKFRIEEKMRECTNE